MRILFSWAVVLLLAGCQSVQQNDASTHSAENRDTNSIKNQSDVIDDNSGIATTEYSASDANSASLTVESPLLQRHGSKKIFGSELQCSSIYLCQITKR